MQHTHRGLYPIFLKDKHGVVIKQTLFLISLPASGILDKFQQYSASTKKFPIDCNMIMPVLSKGTQYVSFL